MRDVHLAAAIAAISLAGVAPAQLEFTWTGDAETNDWNLPGNWSQLTSAAIFGGHGLGFPTSADTAIFAIDAETFGGAADHLIVRPGVTLTLGDPISDAAFDTEVTSRITNDGVIRFAEDPELEPPFANLAAIRVPLDATLTIEGNGVIELNRRGEILGSQRQFRENTSTLVNRAPHRFDVIGDSGIGLLHFVTETAISVPEGVTLGLGETTTDGISLDVRGEVQFFLGTLDTDATLTTRDASFFAIFGGIDGAWHNFGETLFFGSENAPLSLAGYLTNNGVIRTSRASGFNTASIRIGSPIGTDTFTMDGDGVFRVDQDDYVLRPVNNDKVYTLINGTDHTFEMKGGISGLVIENDGVFRTIPGTSLNVSESVIDSSGGTLVVAEESALTISDSSAVADGGTNPVLAGSELSVSRSSVEADGGTIFVSTDSTLSFSESSAVAQELVLASGSSLTGSESRISVRTLHGEFGSVIGMPTSETRLTFGPGPLTLEGFVSLLGNARAELDVSDPEGIVNDGTLSTGGVDVASDLVFTNNTEASFSGSSTTRGDILLRGDGVYTLNRVDLSLQDPTDVTTRPTLTIDAAVDFVEVGFGELELRDVDLVLTPGSTVINGIITSNAKVHLAGDLVLPFDDDPVTTIPSPRRRTIVAAEGGVTGVFNAPQFPEILLPQGFVVPDPVFRLAYNETSVELVVTCLADVNVDGRTDLGDVMFILDNFGTRTVGGPSVGDIDSSGAIDPGDLFFVLAEFLPSYRNCPFTF